MSDKPLARPVSPRLGIGIFCFPIVFAWFTLRKGHTTAAKVMSFGWLLLTVWLVWGGSNDQPKVEAAESAPVLTVSSNKFLDYSDCQLAAGMVQDANYLIKELVPYTSKGNQFTYQDFSEFRTVGGFNSKIDTVRDNYPNVYPLNFPLAKESYSKIIVNFSLFPIDIANSLKYMNDNSRKEDVKNRWKEMKSVMKKIVTQCPSEFKTDGA